MSGIGDQEQHYDDSPTLTSGEDHAATVNLDSSPNGVGMESADLDGIDDDRDDTEVEGYDAEGDDEETAEDYEDYTRIDGRKVLTYVLGITGSIIAVIVIFKALGGGAGDYESTAARQQETLAAPSSYSPSEIAARPTGVARTSLAKPTPTSSARPVPKRNTPRPTPTPRPVPQRGITAAPAQPAEPVDAQPIDDVVAAEPQQVAEEPAGEIAPPAPAPPASPQPITLVEETTTEIIPPVTTVLQTPDRTP